MDFILRRLILYPILIVQCVVLPLLFQRFNIDALFLIPTQVLILAVFMYMRSKDSMFAAKFHADWNKMGFWAIGIILFSIIFGHISYSAFEYMWDNIGVLSKIAIIVNSLVAFVVYLILDINCGHNGYFKDESKNIGIFKGK